MDTIVQLSGFGDTLLGYLLPFLFVLTVVVFVHELGHFVVARWCGVAVKTFSIGFGPEIVGFTDRHGTRWRLSWIPLGGYVKFIDDENAASDLERGQRLGQNQPSEQHGGHRAQQQQRRDHGGVQTRDAPQPEKIGQGHADQAEPRQREQVGHGQNPTSTVKNACRLAG